MDEQNQKSSHKFTPEEISRLGEKIYLNELKNDLEKDHFGDFVVIDVETKKHVVESDRLSALTKARETLGDKLFFIVQIGNLDTPSTNFRHKGVKYAWSF